MTTDEQPKAAVRAYAVEHNARAQDVSTMREQAGRALAAALDLPVDVVLGGRGVEHWLAHEPIPVGHPARTLVVDQAMRFHG